METIITFLKESSYTKYDKSVGEEFILFALGKKEPLQYNRFQKNLVRSVKFITEFSLDNKITVMPEVEDFTSNIGVLIESFLLYREKENRLSLRTRHDDRLYLSKFIHYLNAVEISEVEQLHLSIITNFYNL